MRKDFTLPILILPNGVTAELLGNIIDGLQIAKEKMNKKKDDHELITPNLIANMREYHDFDTWFNQSIEPDKRREYEKYWNDYRW